MVSMRNIFKIIIFVGLLFITNPVYAKQTIARIDIDGDLSNMVVKEDVRLVQISYKSEDMSFNSYATVNLQGESSLKYPKKNYTLNLYFDKDLNNKKKVNLKWGNYSKYTLKANWLDQTHSRNIVGSDIAGDINKKYGYFKNTPNNGAIDGLPLEVYINGEFHGLYTLNLHKDYIFDDGSGRDYILISTDGDFFFGYNNIVEDDKWTNFEVEVGEENEETLAKLNRLLTFINTSSGEEFTKNLENYFNLDSLLNYYCYIRYADLVDSVSNNLFFLTYDGKIWYTVFYDLDISYGYTWFGSNYVDDRRHYLQSTKLWRKLEWYYPDHIAVRYDELRKDIFTKDYINNKFYKFYNSIPKSSLTLDKQKWQELQELDNPTYKIEQVADFIDARTPIIDKEIEKLKTDNYKKVYSEFSQDNDSIDYKMSIYIMAVIFILIVSIVIFLKKIKMLKV